jgi:hypothetical protein
MDMVLRRDWAMPGRPGVCIPAGAKFYYFFLLQNILTGCGDHLASDGYCFCFPRVNWTGLAFDSPASSAQFKNNEK